MPSQRSVSLLEFLVIIIALSNTGRGALTLAVDYCGKNVMWTLASGCTAPGEPGGV